MEMDLYEISKEKICVEMMIFDLLKALDNIPFLLGDHEGWTITLSLVQ